MLQSYPVAVEDVVYRTIDGTSLLARLYKPEGPGPFPGVVEVHGGAWTMNDRLANVAIHQPLAARGVVVMAIDFRMPPDVQYPAPLADINYAVRWLKARAKDYGAAADRIGLLGTSSGGHQAMLAAMRPADPRYAVDRLEAAPDMDATVAFIVLCWSIVDPLARYKMVTSNGNDRLAAAHRAYWPDEAAMAEGAPQLILERGEPAALPPGILLQGTNDDNVTPDMAAKFVAAYKAAGGSMTLHEFPGAPHAFTAREPESAASKQAIENIVAFIAGF